jgi:hypothetical protein
MGIFLDIIKKGRSLFLWDVLFLYFYSLNFIIICLSLQF